MDWHICAGRMIGAKLIIVRDGVIKVHNLATTAVYTDVDGSQPLGGARALDFFRTKQPNYTGNYDPNVRARLANNGEDQKAVHACAIVAKLVHLPGETALVKGHLGLSQGSRSFVKEGLLWIPVRTLFKEPYLLSPRGPRPETPKP